jgi:HK97 family phage prohead protease
METRETRSVPVSASRVKVERRSDGKSVISGYAAVFYNAADPGTEYEMYSTGSERLVERLAPGCFDRALREKQPVVALFNHDANCVLGRTSAGTCRLSSDLRGLRFDVEIDEEASIARDVRAFVKRGDVAGCSFSFGAVGEEWHETKEAGGRLVVRTMTDLSLFDVGPVTYPAYSATSVSARAEELAARRQEFIARRAAAQRQNLDLLRRRQQLAERDL